MKPESAPSRRSSETLTRKQKLLRHFLPVALLTVGGAATANHLNQGEPDGEWQGHAEAHVSASAMVTVSKEAEFGGAESDWGHGAAEDLIKAAVYEGATNAYASVSLGDGVESSRDVDMKELVDELPVYDQATELLEKAGYTEVTPDEGDKLLADVQVTVEQESGSKPVVTYEVVDASINDLPNNQN